MIENLRLLKPYIRGFPIIILAMVIGVLVARKYLSYATPMYESTVKLKLADASEGVPGSNLFKDFDVFASSEKIAAEIEVLKSGVILSKAMETLGFDVIIYRVGKIRKVELYNDSPIRVHYCGLTAKAFDRDFDLHIQEDGKFTILTPDGYTFMGAGPDQPIETHYGVFSYSLNSPVVSVKNGIRIADHYTFKIPTTEALIAATLKNIDIISSDKDVPVIRITFKNAHPEKAARLVNKLAEIYIHDYIETKYRAANITVNFLEDQIHQVLSKLSRAENQIQNFRDRHGITNITQETETDLRSISQLKIQQTNLKMTLEAIQELEYYVQTGSDRFLELAPNFEAFTDLLSTEIIKKIKALQAEKHELLLVYTPQDERVKVIDVKIKDLSSYLIESISNTRRNLESKYRNLTRDIILAEEAFVGLPEKEKMLTIMNREFNIYQSSYNFLNEKKIEAEIAQAAKIAFHRIITPAIPGKEPVSPNRAIITIVSAIMGMFGAVLFIFVVHMLKAKVNDLHSVETNSSIPVAMMTPKLKSAKEMEKHFAREAIQLEIKGLLNGNALHVFSAYKPEEGLIYNVLGIVRAMAAQGRKVLLIDVDNILGLVERHSSITESIEDGIDVCTLDHPDFNRVTKDRMKQFLTELSHDYEATIVLNEPIENNRKATLMMSLADTNFIVLDCRLSPRKKIIETSLLIDEFKIPNSNFLLNRFGYNPNVVVELASYIKKWMRYLKNRKKAEAGLEV